MRHRLSLPGFALAAFLALPAPTLAAPGARIVTSDARGVTIRLDVPQWRLATGAEAGTQRLVVPEFEVTDVPGRAGPAFRVGAAGPAAGCARRRPRRAAIPLGGPGSGRARSRGQAGVRAGLQARHGAGAHQDRDHRRWSLAAHAGRPGDTVLAEAAAHGGGPASAIPVGRFHPRASSHALAHRARGLRRRLDRIDPGFRTCHRGSSLGVGARGRGS
jgi:hypothetical protein